MHFCITQLILSNSSNEKNCIKQIKFSQYKKKNKTMANIEEDIQMEILTTTEFEKLLEEQTPQNSKWSDFEINKIYGVTDIKMVDTQKGQAMVLSLLKYGEVWAPDHLKSRIIKNKLSPPLFIRPLGLKPCKNNPSNKYHAYDLVVRK